MTYEEGAVVWRSDLRAISMPAIESDHERRSSMSTVRWALIAICAAVILLSDRMAGRVGFAVLLVLAIIVGRYASHRYARMPRDTRPIEPAAETRAPDSEVARREAQ